MLTEELRQKANALEQGIKSLIDKFNIEVGVCKVNIDVDYSYHFDEQGHRFLIGNNVKINLTV